MYTMTHGAPLPTIVHFLHKTVSFQTVLFSTVLHKHTDITKHMRTLSEKNGPTVLVGYIFPGTTSNVPKMYSISRDSLKRLRHRTHCPSNGSCWLNDEVKVTQLHACMN